MNEWCPHPQCCLLKGICPALCLQLYNKTGDKQVVNIVIAHIKEETIELHKRVFSCQAQTPKDSTLSNVFFIYVMGKGL